MDGYKGGWIEIIAGGMFSGKSEELIRRLRRAVIARQRVQVFKPLLDDRFSTDEVVSRDERRLKAIAVATSAVRDASNSDEFVRELRERYGIDAQIISGDQEAHLTFTGATLERRAGGAFVLVAPGTLLTDGRRAVAWMFASRAVSVPLE